MIALEVDFNHADAHGRLLLADLASHEVTPFSELAASGDRILFVDGDEYVEGQLVDDPDLGWVGAVDWETQDRIRAYPSTGTGLMRTAT